MFPFGVEPDPTDDAAEPSRGDERGPDSVNRILLHGARHHDREAVFLRWGQDRKGWRWLPTPDWRADRQAIRAALVLRRRLHVAEGERVALWLPFGPGWAEIERGVWSIGAVSVAVDPRWELERVGEVLGDSEPEVLFAPSLDRVRELEAIGGRPPDLRAIVPREAPDEQGDDWLSLARFLDYGGVQDTPERASMWRTFARSVGAGAVATLDHGASSDPGTLGGRVPRPVTQGELVEWAERITRRFPPRRGSVRLLATDRPTLVARVLIAAGWADGLTRTAFAASTAARRRASELAPDLVVGPGREAGSILAELAASPTEPVSSGNGDGRRGPVARVASWLGRAAESVGVEPGPAGPGYLAVDDDPSGPDAVDRLDGRVLRAGELLEGVARSEQDTVGIDGLEERVERR